MKFMYDMGETLVPRWVAPPGERGQHLSTISITILVTNYLFGDQFNYKYGFGCKLLNQILFKQLPFSYHIPIQLLITGSVIKYRFNCSIQIQLQNIKLNRLIDYQFNDQSPN